MLNIFFLINRKLIYASIAIHFEYFTTIFFLVTEELYFNNFFFVALKFFVKTTGKTRFIVA